MESSNGRSRSDSTRSSGKSARRDDPEHQRAFIPTSTSFSSSSRSPYPGAAAPSIASSYATANTHDPSNTSTKPPDLVRNESMADQTSRPDTGSRKSSRRESNGERRRHRSGSREAERDNRQRRRSRSRERDVKRRDSRKNSKKKSSESQRGSAIVTNGSGDRSGPSNLDSHVENQFPGEFPSTFTRPYRPPGLAADYYRDQGESVAHQPGVRPQPPSIIHTADQAHLHEPTAEAAPPPEPSSVGQLGAAASFFANTSDVENTAPVPAGNPSRPAMKPSKHSVTGASPRTPPGAEARPTSFSGNMGVAGAAAIGAAGGLASQYYSASSAPVPGPGGFYTSPTSNTHDEPYVSKPDTSSVRPPRPPKQSSGSNPALYGAAAAGLAAGAGAQYLGHQHHPGQGSYAGDGQQHLSGTQSSSTGLAHRHKRRGPLDKLVNFFKDPEGVAEFEVYTETIGVCKYCFDPRSSPKDAPRKHNPSRRNSGGRYGSNTRVDKVYRQHSSDDEKRRKSGSKKPWVAGGLAAYGLAKLGENVLKNKDFDDTYSVRIGVANGSQPLSDKSERRSSATKERNPLHRSSSGRNTETRIRKDKATGALYEERKPQRRRSSSSSSSSDSHHAMSKGAAISAGIVASEKHDKGHRKRSRSPKKRYYHNRVSPRHSYVDLSDTVPGGTGLSSFFSSPSANHRKGKKAKGIFGFGNVSSSSSDADLAFGEGSVRRKDSKREGIRRHDNGNVNSAILGLAATGVALAAAGSRKESKPRQNVDHARPEGRRGHGSRLSEQRRSHATKSQSSSEGNSVWEDASDDESSHDSALAYGSKLSARQSRESLGSSEGTSKWDWRWNKGKRNKSKTTPEDQTSFAPAAAGLAGAALGRAASAYDRSGIIQGSASLPAMQQLHPIPTSDPGVFDVTRQNSTAMPPMTIVPASITASTVPLHHPQPFTPVSQAVYTASVSSNAPIYDSANSTVPFPFDQMRFSTNEPTARADSLHFNNESEGRRRRDPSPARSTVSSDGAQKQSRRRASTRDQSSSVKFDLTEEQAERERRSHDHDRKKLSRAGDKDKEPREDSAERRRAREQKIEQELERLYKEDDRRQSSERKAQHDDYTVPVTAVAATAAGVAAAAVLAQSMSVEDEERRIREDSRRREASDEPQQSPPSDKSAEEDMTESDRRRRRIAQKVAIRIQTSPSPVPHDDYAAYFIPPELQEKLKEHNDAAERRRTPESNSPMTPVVIEIVPKGGSSPSSPSSPTSAGFKFDPYHYRPFGFRSKDDPSAHPWPVPQLDLIEPTPPHSARGSVRGTVSPIRPASPEPIETPEPEPKRSRSDARVSWGEHQTHEFDVITPMDDLAEFSQEKREQLYNSNDQDRETTPIIEEVQPMESVRGNRRDASKADSQGFGQDLEFAAALAAGAQGAGFDPSIVIDDPTYHRRDSPPGSEDKALYQSPFSETVSDLNTFHNRAAPFPTGFVEGELPPTPKVEDEQTQGEIADSDRASSAKLSKKERKRLEKASMLEPEVEDEQTRREEADTDRASSSKLSKKERKRLGKASKLDPEVEDEQTQREIVDTDGASSSKLSKKERKRLEKASKLDPEVSASSVSTTITPENASHEPELGSSDKADDTIPKIPGGYSVFDFIDEQPTPESKGIVKAGTSEDVAGEYFPISDAVDPTAQGASEPVEDRQPASEDIDFLSKGPMKNPKTSSMRDSDGFYDDMSAVSTPGKLIDDVRGGKKSRGRSKRDEDVQDDIASVVSMPADLNNDRNSKRKSKDKKSGGILSFFSSGKSDVNPKDTSGNDGKKESETSKKKGKRKSKDREIDEQAPARKRSRSGSRSAAQQSERHQSPEDEFLSSEEASERRPRDTAVENEELSFLGERPEMPTVSDGASGSMTERNLAQDVVIAPPTSTTIGPQPPTNASRTRSTSTVPATRERQESMFPDQDLESIPQAEHTPSRRLSELRTSDLSNSPVTTSSPTAVPIHFRRLPMSPGVVRSASVGTSDAASLPSSPMVPRARQGRPISTEFRSKEFRPLWLVERHAASKADQTEIEESYPSLPSSRTSSTHPSMENLQGGQDFEDVFSPDRGSNQPFAHRRSSSYPHWHNERPKSPDFLDSRTATPTATEFPREVKKEKPKYEFHSPSELLQDPATLHEHPEIIDPPLSPMHLPRALTAEPSDVESLPPLPDSRPDSPLGGEVGRDHENVPQGVGLGDFSDATAVGVPEAAKSDALSDQAATSDTTLPEPSPEGDSLEDVEVRPHPVFDDTAPTVAEQNVPQGVGFGVSSDATAVAVPEAVKSDALSVEAATPDATLAEADPERDGLEDAGKLMSSSAEIRPRPVFDDTSSTVAEQNVPQEVGLDVSFDATAVAVPEAAKLDALPVVEAATPDDEVETPHLSAAEHGPTERAPMTSMEEVIEPVSGVPETLHHTSDMRSSGPSPQVADTSSIKEQGMGKFILQPVSSKKSKRDKKKDKRRALNFADSSTEQPDQMRKELTSRPEDSTNFIPPEGSQSISGGQLVTEQSDVHVSEDLGLLMEKAMSPTASQGQPKSPAIPALTAKKKSSAVSDNHFLDNDANLADSTTSKCPPTSPILAAVTMDPDDSKPADVELIPANHPTASSPLTEAFELAGAARGVPPSTTEDDILSVLEPRDGGVSSTIDDVKTTSSRDAERSSTVPAAPFAPPSHEGDPETIEALGDLEILPEQEIAKEDLVNAPAGDSPNTQAEASYQSISKDASDHIMDSLPIKEELGDLEILPEQEIAKENLVNAPARDPLNIPAGTPYQSIPSDASDHIMYSLPVEGESMPLKLSTAQEVDRAALENPTISETEAPLVARALYPDSTTQLSSELSREHATDLETPMSPRNIPLPEEESVQADHDDVSWLPSTKKNKKEKKKKRKSALEQAETKETSKVMVEEASVERQLSPIKELATIEMTEMEPAVQDQPDASTTLAEPGPDRDSLEDVGKLKGSPAEPRPHPVLDDTAPIVAEHKDLSRDIQDNGAFSSISRAVDEAEIGGENHTPILPTEQEDNIQALLAMDAPAERRLEDADERDREADILIAEEDVAQPIVAKDVPAEGPPETVEEETWGFKTTKKTKKGKKAKGGQRSSAFEIKPQVDPEPLANTSRPISMPGGFEEKMIDKPGTVDATSEADPVIPSMPEVVPAQNDGKDEDEWAVPSKKAKKAKGGPRASAFEVEPQAGAKPLVNMVRPGLMSGGFEEKMIDEPSTFDATSEADPVIKSMPELLPAQNDGKNEDEWAVPSKKAKKAKKAKKGPQTSAFEVEPQVDPEPLVNMVRPGLTSGGFEEKTIDEPSTVDATSEADPAIKSMPELLPAQNDGKNEDEWAVPSKKAKKAKKGPQASAFEVEPQAGAEPLVNMVRPGLTSGGFEEKTIDEPSTFDATSEADPAIKSMPELLPAQNDGKNEDDWAVPGKKGKKAKKGKKSKGSSPGEMSGRDQSTQHGFEPVPEIVSTLSTGENEQDVAPIAGGATTAQEIVPEVLQVPVAAESVQRKEEPEDFVQIPIKKGKSKKDKKKRQPISWEAEPDENATLEVSATSAQGLAATKSDAALPTVADPGLTAAVTAAALAPKKSDHSDEPHSYFPGAGPAPRPERESPIPEPSTQFRDQLQIVVEDPDSSKVTRAASTDLNQSQDHAPSGLEMERLAGPILGIEHEAGAESASHRDSGVQFLEQAVRPEDSNRVIFRDSGYIPSPITRPGWEETSSHSEAERPPRPLTPTSSSEDLRKEARRASKKTSDCESSHDSAPGKAAQQELERSGAGYMTDEVERYRDPSPVDSTTKDRSSGLFDSSPSHRFESFEDELSSEIKHPAHFSDAPQPPPPPSRIIAVHSDTQDPAPNIGIKLDERLTEKGIPEQFPPEEPYRSIFGPPSSHDTLERALSPPKTPLHTIPEDDREIESPSLRRQRTRSNAASPTRSHTSTGRSPTPNLEGHSTPELQPALKKLRRSQGSQDMRRASSGSEHSEGHRRLLSPAPDFDRAATPRSSHNDYMTSIGAAGLGAAAILLPRSRDKSPRDDTKSLGNLDVNFKPTTSKQHRARQLDAEGLPSSSTYDPVNAKGKEVARDMADVYDGYGEVPGSPMSPTRPPSIQKRRSMQQIRDLEARLDQLASENRLLAAAKIDAENQLEEVHNNQSRVENASQEALGARQLALQEKDAELGKLREALEWMQKEVIKLTEVNEGLASANQALATTHTQMESQHHDTHTQWQESSRELVTLRAQHQQLSTGMEEIVRHEIDAALAAKNAELRQLYSNLEVAKEKIRELQQQILASQSDEVITARDEDYFDGACQQLCQHVQQWVLRFSKFSDTRICRSTNEVRDDRIVERFENAIVDGSDVDIYLADRIKRRDVFMSVVMTMIWEFIFSRYLFGMDREQRQKLKQLEKNLLEVGPRSAVHRWRAMTLTLLSRRETFTAQRANDTEAVAQEIFGTLARFLPPPQHLEKQILDSLRNVMKIAVDLSVEMRTQRAEYIMLPPLQPEYDLKGDLKDQFVFNAALMNERSGETTSNAELEAQKVVVRMVLFPLVVKKGDDDGEGEEELVVCPAQVLVARQEEGRLGGGGGEKKAANRVVSADRMSMDQKSMRSTHSVAPSTLDMGNVI